MSKFVAILLLSVILAGCVGIGTAQPDCDEMSALRIKISTVMTPEKFKMWVEETYHLPSEGVTLTPITQLPQLHAYVVRWRQNSLWYSAGFEESMITNIDVTAEWLSAGDLIVCLGEPEYYAATYGLTGEGMMELDFNLLFLDQGVIAGGAKFYPTNTEQPPAITDDFPINSLMFRQPGSADDLLQRQFGLYPQETYIRIVNSYKPWPGYWDSIKTEPKIQ
ncbi:MAG: hypothetical protein IPM84_00730 [Anaerolineae bacterium]|nr:hypothetical protein [Anaerolineae bacterium]